jgi:tetratricopeptide (TPR) repeat protein
VRGPLTASRRTVVAASFLLAVGACAGGQEGSPSGDPTELADGYGEHLGTLTFPTSCQDEAARLVERGMALLHHMTYEEAGRAFEGAAEADPECAMGYWGQAMSYIHPLWSDPPGEERFARGAALVARARSVGMTERERAFVAAVEAYYAGGWSLDEAPHLAAWSQGWERAYRRYPDDQEAMVFHALALLGTVDPGDRSYRRQLEAGRIAEQVLAANPRHPGAHHYVIHAYDYPPLAEKALAVARRYGDVAPDIPHALHMPTHIFTRLGLWAESVDWNQRSAAAAMAHPTGDVVSLHYLHALDYLVYAYLQQARDERAEEVCGGVMAMRGAFVAEVATPYALAAVPARLALERRQWADAADLVPRQPDTFPWDDFPAMEAITRFARALGGARGGRPALARAELDTLALLRDRAEQLSGTYWARQVEIQRLSALAWLEYESGEPERALATMRSAAELEASTEKHPVTPGEILPARELLADMLLVQGRYHEALIEYESSLRRSPYRFNSLYGAGRAAERGGNRRQASVYYRMLTEVTAGAGAGRRELREARAFLAAQ